MIVVRSLRFDVVGFAAIYLFVTWLGIGHVWVASME